MPDTTPKTYGGLAVLEGVMMRSPLYFSVACRAGTGEIVVITEPIVKSWIGRQKWLMKPFLRGTFAMLDTMIFGYKAMNFSALVASLEHYLSDKDKETLAAQSEKKGKPVSSELTNGMIVVALVTSLALGFFLFQFAPQAVAELISRASGNDMAQNKNLMATNYLAEVVKLVFILAYLSLISLYPAIREVFRYHGAEHKAINAMEAGQDLTVPNVKAQTRLHPRCGTNFVIIVFMVSFLLQPLIPRDLFVPATSPGWLITLTRMPVEIAMAPVIAGISYEIIRLAGRAKNQMWVRTFLAPGLATQLITTAEPNEGQCEVAIAALKAAVLAEETGELTNNFISTKKSALNAAGEPSHPNNEIA